MGPMGNNLTERTQLEKSRVQLTLPGRQLETTSPSIAAEALRQHRHLLLTVCEFVSIDHSACSTIADISTAATQSEGRG